MTKEDKELLLRDLCARLPYGIICLFIWTYSNETTDGEVVITKNNDNIKCINIHTEEIQADYYDEWVDLKYCKPYLRPMSSMTEDEEAEYESIKGWKNEWELVDWLNAHHFDYRGLIEKGLALEAPEGMYNN